MAARKSGLGRNLNALLSQVSPAVVARTATGEKSHSDASKLRQLPIEWLSSGKYQPRGDMEPTALQELADSIKAQGIIQPILVRPIGKNQYEIIAGERRWRAAQLARLADVPVIINDIPDETAIAVALIENIQREDLNPIEEARALHRLQEEFQLTHQQVADAVGKSRTTVTNLLRLMTLHPQVKTMLEHGDIEMGHARALLGLIGEVQIQAAHTVSAKNLSVRETEKLVRRLQQPKQVESVKKLDPNIESLQRELSERLAASVQFQHHPKGKGKLIISYSSLDELDGILSKIN